MWSSQTRIIAALGARVTSMAKKGEDIVIGYSTTPDLAGRTQYP